MVIKDCAGYTIDAGTHCMGPDRLLITISNPREESISVSLQFTQVVRLAGGLSDWLNSQADRRTEDVPPVSIEAETTDLDPLTITTADASLSFSGKRSSQ